MPASLLTVTPLTASGIPHIFHDLSYSSLIAWYKADAITGVSNGSALSSWLNSSQAGDVTLASAVSQSSGASQPIFRSAGLNSKPSVEFNFGQVMLAANISQAQPFTLFAVSSLSSIGAFQADITGQNAVLGQDNIGTQWWTISGARLDSLRSTATNENVFAGAIISGSSSTLVVGTSASSKSTFGNAGSSPVAVWAVGANGIGSAFWGGQIAEVMLYGRALPNAEFQTVLAYLSNKYGI